MSEGEAFDRRDFLRISGGAVVSVAILGCGTNAIELNRALFAVGSVTSFPAGSVAFFDGGPFFVVRDAGGLYALTAICTHQQCALEAGTNQFSCPCHESTFALDGSVTQGPARSPLVHFLVTVEGDEVSVDTREEVPVATRVAL